MRKVMFCIMLLVFYCVKINAQTDVSFSFQAHQDDWQLFMSSKIVGDLSAGGKVVFVTLTAGDAGNGTVAYGSPVPFFLARENGSVYSSKFAVDLSGGVPDANPDSFRVTVNGHSIVKYVYKNKAVNYFFRLPDGGGNGDGNALTGFKSLRKLKEGTITSISSVDGTATYNSWADLTATIKNIITIERGLDNQVWIHTPGLTASNPGDHSDHIFTGVAAQDATVDSLWVGINEFVDYASASLPGNLNNSDHSDAAGVFATCIWGLMSVNYSGPFDEGHKSWLPMDYFSVKRAPSGFANNNFTTSNNNLRNKNNQPFLTEIPMTVAKSTQNSNKVEMLISPYQTGELLTEVYNSKGVKIYNTITAIKERKAILLSIENTFKTPGQYVVKHILNGKYSETKKIEVN